MPTWRRICCAVDLSDPSRAAAHEAADLARMFGAELTLLHVSSPAKASMVATTDVLAPSIDEINDQIRTALEAELQKWKEEAHRRSEHPVSTAVVSGAPAEEIVRFARERGFDLLVLATHGRAGVRRMVLGSVAEHVVRDATVPVLVVRAAAERRP